MKRTILALALVLAAASPAAAHTKHYIEVIDTSFETGWARYPIDAIYGSPMRVRYSGSERARFTCRSEAGVIVWRSDPLVLTGEGGPGVSVDILNTDMPYVAGTYAFCVAELLGKKDRVIASDLFTIYSPV